LCDSSLSWSHCSAIVQVGILESRRYMPEGGRYT
jgi:hypothetical protein